MFILVQRFLKLRFCVVIMHIPPEIVEDSLYEHPTCIGLDVGRHVLLVATIGLAALPPFCPRSPLRQQF